MTSAVDIFGSCGTQFTVGLTRESWDHRPEPSIPIWGSPNFAMVVLAPSIWALVLVFYQQTYCRRLIRSIL